MGDGGCWNPLFSRHFNDWVLEEAERFLAWIGEKKVVEGRDDSIHWVEAENGLFFVKDMYKALEPRPTFSFPMKSIWKNCVQPKIILFCLGSNIGKDSNSGAAAEKRLCLV